MKNLIKIGYLIILSSLFFISSDINATDQKNGKKKLVEVSADSYRYKCLRSGTDCYTNPHLKIVLF